MRDLGRASVGVNFDPANMILYGMGEPGGGAAGAGAAGAAASHQGCESFAEARGSGARKSRRGRRGGLGRFFGFVREMMPRVGLVVEREAGSRRVEDVKLAVEMIESHLGNGDS